MRPNKALNDIMAQKGYLSLPEAAKLSGLTSATFYAAIKAGKIQSRRVQARHYLKVEDVRTFAGLEEGDRQ